MEAVVEGMPMIESNLNQGEGNPVARNDHFLPELKSLDSGDSHA